MPCWYELTSVRISPFCELARWVLELAGIAYKESCHAPIWGGGSTPPIVKAPDAVLDARSLLEYLDTRLPESEKLYPLDPEQRRHVETLVQSFFDHLALDVRLYAYANMLPNARVTAPLMTDRAPWWE